MARYGKNLRGASRNVVLILRSVLELLDLGFGESPCEFQRVSVLHCDNSVDEVTRLPFCCLNASSVMRSQYCGAPDHCEVVSVALTYNDIQLFRSFTASILKIRG